MGVARTFQNLALFNHMTVLENIMVGRHHQLKNNALSGSLYWFTGAQKEELAHRREVEEIIDFLETPTKSGKDNSVNCLIFLNKSILCSKVLPKPKPGSSNILSFLMPALLRATVRALKNDSTSNIIFL